MAHLMQLTCGKVDVIHGGSHITSGIPEMAQFFLKFVNQGQSVTQQLT